MRRQRCSARASDGRKWLRPLVVDDDWCAALGLTVAAELATRIEDRDGGEGGGLSRRFRRRRRRRGGRGGLVGRLCGQPGSYSDTPTDDDVMRDFLAGVGERELASASAARFGLMAGSEKRATARETKSGGQERSRTRTSGARKCETREAGKGRRKGESCGTRQRMSIEIQVQDGAG